MQQLTFLQTRILCKKGLTIQDEHELGIITGDREVVNALKPLLIEFFSELGATHWEETTVNGHVDLMNVPDNFYGQDNDSFK